jgi:Holliday junction resolvasome RuvABC ATP-dependent DNA helicase subunit
VEIVIFLVMKLIRDKRFPIRCTFQYYRVTDTRIVIEHDVKDIKAQLSQSTTKSIASGSLVLTKDSSRTTEPKKSNVSLTDSLTCFL